MIFQDRASGLQNEKDDHKGFKYRIHKKIICDQENLLASSAVVQQCENGHLAKRQVETQMFPLLPHSTEGAVEVTPVSRVQSSDCSLYTETGLW